MCKKQATKKERESEWKGLSTTSRGQFAALSLASPPVLRSACAAVTVVTLSLLNLSITYNMNTYRQSFTARTRPINVNKIPYHVQLCSISCTCRSLTREEVSMHCVPDLMLERQFQPTADGVQGLGPESMALHAGS